MAKRENPMAVRSKTALSTALLKAMMSRPFHEISISDIAEKAGLARQTFYTNFSKKEDILHYLIAGLFDHYERQLTGAGLRPDELMVDYFFFWDRHKSFLSLIFRQNLGYIFQEENRAFFVNRAHALDAVFSAEPWQMPYLRSSIAGLTYELLTLWIVDDCGLDIHILSALAQNLLSGKIFAPPAAS